MMDIDQAAAAVSGREAVRSRRFAELLAARSDLRTLADALALSDGRNPSDADRHAAVALEALTGLDASVARRLNDAFADLGEPHVLLGPELLEGSPSRMFARVSEHLAGLADALISRLRADGVRPPHAFCNLVWLVQRRPDEGADIKLAAVTTDMRAPEYVSGVAENHPGAEVFPERVLMDHVYGLRDTIQGIVVGALMRTKGLGRPPSSLRRGD